MGQCEGIDMRLQDLDEVNTLVAQRDELRRFMNALSSVSASAVNITPIEVTVHGMDSWRGSQIARMLGIDALKSMLMKHAQMLTVEINDKLKNLGVDADG